MVLVNKDQDIDHFIDGEAMTSGFAKKILQENALIDKIQLEKVKNYCTFAKRPTSSILKVNKSNLYK